MIPLLNKLTWFKTVAIFSLLVPFITSEIQTKSHCSAEDKICEFNLTISNWWTMIHFADHMLGMLPAFVGDDGQMYARSKDCSDNITLSKQEQDRIVTGDGTYKPVLVINGQLPGPAIVVYEGQQVVIHFNNEMRDYVTTLHWHGLNAKGVPYMDGVGGVSQCPVHPGESFTYRFMALDVGTHWYHSHYGSQRSMGAYGPLIVLPKPGVKDNINTSNTTEYADDYIIMVSDWMHQSTPSINDKIKHDNLAIINGLDVESCYASTKQADGVEIGIVPFDSAIINGKGRNYADPGRLHANQKVPLETFTVKKGQSLKYRFRLISASMFYALRVSVDNHYLHVIASDGIDLQENIVESIILQPGERYDFWIETTDPLSVGNYWIRAETLEETQDNKPIVAGHTEAILHYEGYTNQEPQTNRDICTDVRPCLILNCPFNNFTNSNKSCVQLTDLTTVENQSTIVPQNESELEEIFLNFHFSGINEFKMYRPNINGKVMKLPNKPPQRYLDDSTGISCNNCSGELCYCTHQLDIPLNKVIQMVIFISLDKNDVAGTHPVHIHGHHVQVIKIGYPTYDNITGKLENFTSDITCVDELCNKARWTDPSWNGGNVPDVISQGAPLKDTVAVPAGGYVIARFRSDNPGFWFLHCHMEIHNEMGMSLIIKEGSIQDMPQPPASMNTCGDFRISQVEWEDLLTSPRSPEIKEAQNSSMPSPDIQHKCSAMSSLFYKLTFVFLVLFAAMTITTTCQLFNYANMSRQLSL